MSRIFVEIVGVNGDRIPLEDDRIAGDGIVFLNPAGLTGDIKRDTRPNSNGVGVRVGGYSFNEIAGSLHCYVCSDRRSEASVGEVYRRLVDAVSTVEEAEIRVTDSKGVTWSAKFVLTEELPDLEFDPNGPTAARFPVDVPITIHAGVFTNTRDFVKAAGATDTIEIQNRGNIPAPIQVGWSGNKTITFTPPGATTGLWTATLPPTTPRRWLTLDPGMGFTVTDDNGAVDSSTWSKFKGQYVPGMIDPRKTATITATGTGAVTIRYVDYSTNPWR